MAVKSPVPPSPSPLLALSAGLVTLLASAALSRFEGLPLLRELTLFGGTALVLIGLVGRLRVAGWEFRDRAETAAYLSTAGALAAALALGGINQAWGSARLLFSFASILAFGATLLVLLPPVPRKVALSLWVVFHFVGMFTSFSSIDPPGNQGPFLPKQLWTFVYRPYLSFLYMTNAYHFYSPDPGPPALLWFAVHYSDGSYTWFRIPTKEKGQIGMQYQRLLALPEHSFSQTPSWPQGRAWEDMYERRMLGSGVKYALPGKYIPLPSDLEPAMQYREPNETSKLLIAAVARRVMRLKQREGVEVRSVKAYRVVHQLITAYELSKNLSPFEKTKYWPYFLGEFDADGHLVDPLDPFLYWYVPIVKVPSSYPNHKFNHPTTGVPMLAVRVPAAAQNFELDGLEMHASVPAKGRK